MAAAPWILLAVGIGIVILGFLIASLSGGSGGYIDPRMSDKEIKRQLKKDEGNPIGGWVMMFGALVVLVSIVWRLVRYFV